MESHQRDHENYVACSRSHRRRAKALLDFERHDDDELGFRKNDIITVRGHVGAASARGGELGSGKQGDPGPPGICPCSTHMAVGTGPGNQSFASSSSLPTAQIISQKDEHCWVGELNGLRGEASVWRRGGPGIETRSPSVTLRLQQEPGFLSLPACPHAAPTGPCFPRRLVSSQVCGSPG